MVPTVALIDNDDSFTLNVVALLEAAQLRVRLYARSDQPTPSDYDGLVIGPGPGHPQDASSSLQALSGFASQQKPIWGICMGHQCMGLWAGATITMSAQICHGKTTILQHKQQGLFADLPQGIRVMRYHSWVVDAASLSNAWEVTAFTDDAYREVMAIAHRQLPLWGVQFHPESILSEQGLVMACHFAKVCT